jgi:glycosyltransferase involved in cell wall biosynthesis
VTPIPPIPFKQNTHDDSILTRHGLEPHQYILYLGTIEPRKNIERLVEGYSLLPDEVRNTHPLVLAGGRGWKDETIRATIEAYRTRGFAIITTGYITDEEKYSLYHNASCYTLPSHYEGFGMPVLEAMQHHVPVAVSDIPVFREVAGDAAAYFDKDDPDSVARTIGRILTDTPYRNSLIAAQQSELDKYSWSTNAQVVTAAFNQLTKR